MSALMRLLLIVHCALVVETGGGWGADSALPSIPLPWAFTSCASQKEWRDNQASFKKRVRLCVRASQRAMEDGE